MDFTVVKKVLPPTVTDVTAENIYTAIKQHAQDLPQERRLLMSVSLYIKHHPDWNLSLVEQAIMEEMSRSTKHKTVEVKADVDLVHDTVTEGSKAAPGQHKCVACESKGRSCFDTSFTVKQVRSCDEPPSVFVRCRQCGRQWSYNG